MGFPVIQLVCSVGVALLAGVVAAQVWLALRGADEPPDRVAVARITRTAMLAGFAVAYAFLSRNGSSLAIRCGFVPTHGAVRTYALGFAIAVFSVVIVVAALLALGARHAVAMRVDAPRILLLALRAVGLGLLLATVEESLFRGLLLRDFTRSIGTVGGVAAGSLFFALTHFLGAPSSWRKSSDPCSSGVDVVLAVFQGLGRMSPEWPEFVGLILVGAILSVLRLRTGTLYLAMGVHAGWYWIKQMDRYFVDEDKAMAAAHPIWIGSEQYVDGILGWAGLLLSLWLSLLIRVPEAVSSRPPRRSQP